MSAISIIVPVYNQEKLLNRCLDSILCQTFDDFEIIIVNDGSTDNSGKICDEYATKDRRVKVIHQKNKGVSSARQTGLDAACGVFVIHADPDDWIERDMLNDLYKLAISENADVVICDFYVNDNGKEIYSKQKPEALCPHSVLRQLFNNLHGSCCNKLIKRELFTQYNISFPQKINYCEDLLVCVQIFSHEHINIVYLPKAYYHYFQHSQSITHIYTTQTFDIRKQYQKLLEEYLPAGYDCEIRKSRLNIYLEAFIKGILTNPEARKIVWKNRMAAFVECESLRWKVGYLTMFLGWHSITKRIIQIYE